MAQDATEPTDSTVPTRDRCDICTEAVDRAAGDTPHRRIADNVVAPDDLDMTAPDVIDALAEAVASTETIHDERLARALRAKHGWYVHERCLAKTSLVFQDSTTDESEGEQ